MSTFGLLAKLYILVLLAAALFTTFADASNNPVIGGLPLEPLSQYNPLCAATEKEGALQLFLIIVLLAICVMLIYFLHRFHVHWFPESIGVILIGVVVGLILRFMPVSLNSVTRLDAQIFFEILLPAIIFEAGYTLEKEDFFYNIGSIILFAFVGTVISTIVVASGIYMLGYWGLFKIELGLVDCLLFGSLISAVDPVATLAIFSALKVNPTLHYLVFGESIVNDAVAITLFTTFKAFKTASPADNTVALVLKGLGIFTLNSLGSVIFAIILGLLSAVFFKYVSFEGYPVALEITIFIAFAYGPYLIALPYLSGIMCILIAGIVMSYYTSPNLTKQAQNAISVISKSGAFICETFVFIYMGMAVFSFSNLYWDILLIIAVIILCMIGRFLNITPLSLMVNFYRKERITFKNQFIMWFSGLRGAIAFALSIEFLEEGVEGQFLFTTTLAVVLFTIVVFGGGTYPLLKLFKIKSKDEELNERKEQNMRESSLHEELVLKINKRFLRNWFMRKEVLAEMRAELKAATEKEKQLRDQVNRGEDEENRELRVTRIEIERSQLNADLEDPMSLFQTYMNDRRKLEAAREAMEMYDKTFRDQ